MAELSRRTRILLAVGLAGAAGAVTLGGVAYAVGGSGDSAGDSAYVQLDGSNATTQDTQPETTPEGGTDGTQPRGDRDCPEKDGSAGGQGGQDGTETPAQPETPDNSNAAGRA